MRTNRLAYFIIMLLTLKFCSIAIMSSNISKEKLMLFQDSLVTKIVESENQEAVDFLLKSAFIAGNRVVPELKELYKHGSTRTFAAQALAYTGSEGAIEFLIKEYQKNSASELNLFLYGSLSAYKRKESRELLLEALIGNDPDKVEWRKTVCLALKVLADPETVDPIQRYLTAIREPMEQREMAETLRVIKAKLERKQSKDRLFKHVSADQKIRSAIQDFFSLLYNSAPILLNQESVWQDSEKERVRVHLIVDTPIYGKEGRSLVRVKKFMQKERGYEIYDIILKDYAGEWEIISAWQVGFTDLLRIPNK